MTGTLLILNKSYLCFLLTFEGRVMQQRMVVVPMGCSFFNSFIEL